MNQKSDEPSSLAQKAALLATEKQRREEMLVVRKTFKEPVVERDRPPQWVSLLQAKKKEISAAENVALQETRWNSCLQRQQWAISRQSDNVSMESSAKHTAGATLHKSQGSGKNQEYMSAWLRQLHSEASDPGN